MPRYAITVEYDGEPFAGWQAQRGRPTVQGVLEDAVKALTGEEATVFGSGRTDAGVHALGQVGHFDLEREWRPETLRDGLNFHLKPQPVSVLDAVAAPDDFHCRFSARQRHYLYRIVDRRSPPALDRRRAWHVPRGLDAGAMEAAARHLVGHHDFTTFRAAQCQSASPVKTLDVLAVTREDEEVRILASARSFLHNQVRSMVGTLKLVGEGKWTADDVLTALASRNRAACGPVAPPWGLYLLRVDYDETALRRD